MSNTAGASGVDAAPSFSREFKRVLKQPAFIIASIVLLISALGFNFVTNWMQLTFRKLPVPLRADLTSIKENLGPWSLVTRNETLDKEMQDALGTDKYIFRDFVDSRVIPNQEIAQFKDLPLLEGARKLSQIQQRNPQAVINAAVTYYTGLVDTVAHIPDRCYIADGYQPTKYSTKTWTVNGKSVQVRFITFEDETSKGRIPRTVVYFFKVNGNPYTSDPLEVRRSLMKLTERYGYYSKVELMMLTRADEEAQTEKAMVDYLTQALPEIEKCWPDWEAVKKAQEVTPAGIK